MSEYFVSPYVLLWLKLKWISQLLYLQELNSKICLISITAGLEAAFEAEAAPKVVTVPFRVPSSLPPSEGVLRLHSQRDCHPFVEKQIQDEKCPQKCTSKCLEIPFRLASSIRQILLISDKTDYQPGDTGMNKHARAINQP